MNFQLYIKIVFESALTCVFSYMLKLYLKVHLNKCTCRNFQLYVKIIFESAPEEMHLHEFRLKLFLDFRFELIFDRK